MGVSAYGMRYAGFLVRLTLAFVFIGAGAAKLADPAAFAWNIHQFGLVPRPLIDPLAICLPVLEAASGVGLVFDRRWSYGAVAGILVLFMTALGHAILAGLNVDCGCFGAGEPGPDGLRATLFRDIALSAGLAATWIVREKRSEQGRTTTTSLKEDR
jgi:uncharacterized membrane protein YphA (DoxX/SURF4 family)